MNLWETQKELISLRRKCLTDDEKRLVISLLEDINFYRYLNENELNLLSKLKNQTVYQRGER